VWLDLMSLPIELQDINLLLAVNALILLVTLEVFSSQSGNNSIQVNMQRLKIAAVTVSILFLVSMAMRIIAITLAL